MLFFFKLENLKNQKWNNKTRLIQQDSKLLYTQQIWLAIFSDNYKK